MEGVELWRNPKNRFLIFQLHYTANPLKRDPNWKDKVKSGLSRAKFMQEYEIAWDAYLGKPVYSDFSKKVHGSQSRLSPERGLPLLRGWDFGLCYDDETEVLTKAGWKLFKDVSETEEVATLNSQSFEMTYEVPKLKVDQAYTGEMIHWGNDTLQASVTPDHIVPVWKQKTKEFCRYYAKDLMGQGHNLIRLTAQWNGKDQENPLGLSPKLFAAFMGAYLSEGCSDSKRIAIYQQDSNKEWLRKILVETGWDWREVEDGFRLYSLKKAKYLQAFGLAHEKSVPDVIRFGSREVIGEFIRTYTLGDGHIRVRKGIEEHTIYSKSKRMIDDLSDLALKVGWTSSIAKVKSATSYLKSEDRYITSAPGWNIRFKKTSDWSHLRGAKKESRHYSGRIYCLSVSSGILCVRKNGRPHWNGNTPSCVISQMQGRQLVVLKEYVAVNMGIKRFASEVVLPGCRLLYPEWNDQKTDYLDFIDPAGLQRAQTDETTCAQHMFEAGIRNIYPGALTFEARRKAVEDFLLRFFRRNQAVMPGFLIDLAACPTLVEGFEGGYQYPKKTLEVEPEKIRPLKNKFSHPHDALQYLASMVGLMTRPGFAGSAIPVPSYALGRT